MTDKPGDVWIPVNVAAPLLGIGERQLRRKANDGEITAIRDESDRRRPFLILLDSLSEPAQNKYRADQASALVPCRSESTQLAPLVQPAPLAVVAAAPDERYAALWPWYEKLGAGSKQRALAAFDAVDDFAVAVDSGVSIGMASAVVIAKYGISEATLARYRADIDGSPRGYWLPLLAPRYCGNGKEAEFTEEAYEWILSRHLTQTKTRTSVLVRLARAEGKSKGWKIPSTKTVDRRLKREPAPLVILGREGPKALEASFPTVEKDWAVLPLHEMWESDGCRLNVMAKWPDGSIGRPMIVTWRECRSRLVLSCKGHKNTSGELVMAALYDAVSLTGLKPKKAKLDNGPEYANKPFSGQQKTRYRFSVKPGEPVGVAKHLGIDIFWSPPGRGRDKTIESWHRWLHENVEQRPEFAGAYCGPNALAKPEDFDQKKAVPIELVNKLLAEALHHFNTEKPHRGRGMNGRTPQAVYEELYPSVNLDEHRADPAHARLLLMAVKMLKPAKDNATFTFTIEGFEPVSYWNEEFSYLPLMMRDKQFAVWYHPANTAAPIAIWDGKRHVCDCFPRGMLPPTDAGDAAAAHVKQKHAYTADPKRELKIIKAASPVLLPSFIPGTPALIEPRREPPEQREPAQLLQPTGTPGELVNTKTGRTILRIERPAPEPHRAVDWDRLAELKRQQQAKRAVG